MKQPVRGSRKRKAAKKKGGTGKRKTKPDFGTSGLERYFAENFLDRYGLRYIYQYKANDIGRFYDFAVTADKTYPYLTENINGVETVKQGKQPFKVDFIIEVDGDWYHANPSKVNESELNPMQKHNRMVDKIKDKWCALNGIPLLRIWENDIRNDPKKVLSQLSKFAKIANTREKKRVMKKRPH